jgi:hypothetical protein
MTTKPLRYGSLLLLTVTMLGATISHATTITFNDTDLGDDPLVVLPLDSPYSESGFLFTSSADSFDLVKDPFLAQLDPTGNFLGLSESWGVTALTISQSSGGLFDAISVRGRDLSFVCVSCFNSYSLALFTGLTAAGDTVTQLFPSVGGDTLVFSEDFTGLSSLSVSFLDAGISPQENDPIGVYGFDDFVLNAQVPLPSTAFLLAFGLLLLKLRYTSAP